MIAAGGSAGAGSFWVSRLEEAPSPKAQPAPEQPPAAPQAPAQAPAQAPPKAEPPADAPAEVPKKPAAAPAAAAAKRAAGGTINVDQEMLKLRRIFITGDINDDLAKVVTQQLFFLEAEDPTAPVTVFINSGGGLVHSGLAILDVMTHVSMPLNTVAYGRCFSIAALLLSAGTPGHRSAYENARLMVHEPSCSYPKLQASDMVIKVDELRHTQRTLEEVLSQRTGRTREEIAAAVARDRYMSVAEARDFGLLDHVFTSSAPPKPKAAPAGA